MIKSAMLYLVLMLTYANFLCSASIASHDPDGDVAEQEVSDCGEAEQEDSETASIIGPSA
jgi:hypothetical protein